MEASALSCALLMLVPAPMLALLNLSLAAEPVTTTVVTVPSCTSRLVLSARVRNTLSRLSVALPLEMVTV